MVYEFVIVIYRSDECEACAFPPCFPSDKAETHSVKYMINHRSYILDDL